jgi:predicted phosphoribosyltransferase
MEGQFLFQDRAEAGRQLAERIRVDRVITDRDVIVLALPRGGVPVGFEIARELGADLDVFLVRKLGVPGHEELAMGAIASGGVRVLNESLVEYLGISSSTIHRISAREQQEIDKREHLYRNGCPARPIAGRTAILVDDGLATGATMLAAVKAVRAQQPNRIIVAVPVASREACDQFASEVDDVICAATPEPFYAVGAWYEDFSQTSDREVRELLARAEHAQQVITKER